jgi:hypothetical protein
MKMIIKYSTRLIVGLVTIIWITACNNFLDMKPLSTVTPNDYLWGESDLAAYTIAHYNFPTHYGWGPGTFGIDNNTDNQATSNFSNIWVPGEWRVSQSGGSWDFLQIRENNYFIETVVPRWKANKINGDAGNVAHYIGEAYFLRAYEYFNKVQALGDFPIIKKTFTDNEALLTAASQRRPRNEVARFILADLDSAILLLRSTPPGSKNRISKNAALLFKSRVALHEATWLTYHKGTAQVPGGTGWPGTGKIQGYSINIDNEIDFFLTQAMDASSAVADNVPLVNNTKDNGYNSSQNPYAAMFADIDMNKYSEVLLWRAYDTKFGISHNVNAYLNPNGANTGYTKGLVDNFVMANGLPIYASGSGYMGDDSTQLVKKGRDNRLQLFMKTPGDLLYTDSNNPDGTPKLEGYPDIIRIQEERYVTGYAVKKGFSYLVAQSIGNQGSIGSIIFRATEAYLNYIEASYLKNKSVNSKADLYWKAIRARAGIDPDYNITINATDMTKEAKNDWAAYSAGHLLVDKTLYNIRRERRCELIAEGMRMFDLKRWRALDQLNANPYIIEGFKLWGPMAKWYNNADGTSKLIEAGTAGQTANVSKKSESLYLRPYRVNMTANNLVKDGYKWISAHYLEPIAIQNFIITATDKSDLTTSVIYQNPGWSLTANSGGAQ